jgi:type IV pilus assembly protein PilA
MKKNMQGFTLIELMIVVAIIAILAAIALPAYQDYLVKSRVSEVVLAASSARTTVSEAAAADPSDDMPATAEIESQASKYVGAVTYAAGVITATATDAVGGEVEADQTITLTGTKATNGQVDWVCNGTIPGKYRPATCQGVAAPATGG